MYRRKVGTREFYADYVCIAIHETVFTNMLNSEFSRAAVYSMFE